MGGFARLDISEEPIPGFCQVSKRLRMRVTVDGFEPWLPAFVEPLRVAVFDGVELLFQCHRIGFMPRRAVPQARTK